jgi:hypothetical protein
VVRKDNFCAVMSQPFHDGGSNAPASTQHQCFFTLQYFHVYSPWLRHHRIIKNIERGFGVFGIAMKPAVITLGVLIRTVYEKGYSLK